MGTIAFRVCTFEGSFPSSVGNLREVTIGHIDRNTATCTDVHCVGWTKKKVKPQKIDDVGTSDIGRMHPYTCT